MCLERLQRGGTRRDITGTQLGTCFWEGLLNGRAGTVQGLSPRGDPRQGRDPRGAVTHGGAHVRAEE